MALTSVKGLSKQESRSSPTAAVVKQDIFPPPEGPEKGVGDETETSKPLENNLTEDKDMELMDIKDEARTDGTAYWTEMVPCQYPAVRV